MPAKGKKIVFRWEGKNKNNQIIKGEISAISFLMAKAQLRNQGITPIKIKKKPKPLFSSRLLSPKVTNTEITTFTRQLATLLAAGVPLVQALEIITQSIENPALNYVVNTMKTDVESGMTLSSALVRNKKYFSNLYCSLVAAGEQSGQLDVMLDQVASYKEKLEDLHKKVKKALVYPTSVLAIAFLVTGGLLLFIVPQFEKIFSGFGAELPFATRLVLFFSNLLTGYWVVVVGLVMLLMVGFFQGRKRSAAFDHVVQRALLHIPVIGLILRKAVIARFARTLSITFAAGMPLVDALKSVASVTGHIVYYNATQYIVEGVTAGQQMQQAMSETGVFPSMVIQMVGIGEESGSFEFMLEKVANFYESEVDTAVSSLSSLLEPIIMVILGVLIGGLVIAMYMPIFKLGGVI